MCKAFDDHYKTGKREGIREGKREGKREGIRKGHREGMAHGIYMLIRMGKKYGEDADEIVKELKECFLLEESTALDFIEKYEDYQFEYAKVQ